MKLHQLVSSLTENEKCYGAPGHAPQLVDLTLHEIVKSGKITNPYQTLVVARVAEFFKNGLKSADLQFENPVLPGSEATSSATRSYIEMLDPIDQVELAEYLLWCLEAGECLLHNQQMNVADWIRYVIKKQD